MNGKEVLKKLKNAGFALERITGSHHIMIKDNNLVSVPVHGKKDLKAGTLKAIEKESGVRLK